MNFLSPFDGEKNGVMLLKIARHWQAKKIGDINNFFAVTHDWCCPSCLRSKFEISRLHSKAGHCQEGLLCSICEHHDHFRIAIAREISRKEAGEPLSAAYDARFVRFAPTYICKDCNNADPCAKRAIGAPDNFSFAPHEIATFITVRPHETHEIDWNAAEEAWHAAKPTHDRMEGSLRALAKQIRGEPDFESLFDAAKRVQRDVRDRMDGNGTVT